MAICSSGSGTLIDSKRATNPLTITATGTPVHFVTTCMAEF